MTRSSCRAADLAWPQLISNAPMLLAQMPRPNCFPSRHRPQRPGRCRTTRCVCPSVTGLAVEDSCLSWTPGSGPSGGTRAANPGAVAPAVGGQRKSHPCRTARAEAPGLRSPADAPSALCTGGRMVAGTADAAANLAGRVDGGASSDRSGHAVAGQLDRHATPAACVHCSGSPFRRTRRCLRAHARSAAALQRARGPAFGSDRRGDDENGQKDDDAHDDCFTTRRVGGT